MTIEPRESRVGGVGGGLGVFICERLPTKYRLVFYQIFL
jgi:hypothetical protein